MLSVSPGNTTLGHYNQWTWGCLTGYLVSVDLTKGPQRYLSFSVRVVKHGSKLFDKGALKMQQSHRLQSLQGSHLNVVCESRGHYPRALQSMDMELAAYLASVGAAIAPNSSPVEVYGLDCEGGETLAQVFRQTGALKIQQSHRPNRKERSLQPGSSGKTTLGHFNKWTRGCRTGHLVSVDMTPQRYLAFSVRVVKHGNKSFYNGAQKIYQSR